MCESIQEILKDEYDIEILVLPANGYLYSVDELLDNSTLSIAKRGTSQTFNTSKLKADLEKAMKSETFHFPAFDYDLLKDPVPDQLKYEKGKHKIILIEGTNVLSKNEPWSQISQMFDKMYFLHTS